MKYTIWTKATFLAIASILTLTAPELLAQPNAQVSVQLQIILKDEACLHVIDQIKKLHDTLEQTLSTQFSASNNQAQQCRQKFVTYIKTNFKLKEKATIWLAEKSIIKALLALCDASSAFIEEIMDQSQAQHEILKSFKEKAIKVCQNIKKMICGSEQVAKTSGAGANPESIDQCYKLIAHDLNLFIHQPNVVINNIPVTLQDLDNHIQPYTVQFSRHLKIALAQHLSNDDIQRLIKFFESSAYQELKKHSPQILELLLPGAKTKAEGLFNETWKQTGGTIISFLHKLKSSNS